MNRSALAVLFGVSMPTVDGWRQRGCPVESRGSKGVEYRFDPAAVFSWRIKCAVEDALAGVATDLGKISKDEADRRRAVATAVVAEITAADTLDDVVSRQDAQAEMVAFTGAIESQLKQAAVRIAALAAPLSSAPGVQQICEAELNRGFAAARGELATKWADQDKAAELEPVQ